MICYRLDTQLLKIAKSARAIYTRYADDITFSTYQPPSLLFQGSLPAAGRFSPDILAPAVISAFKGNGFTIHPDKTHYADRHSRRIVTGVKINAGLNVDRRYVRNIRAITRNRIFRARTGHKCDREGSRSFRIWVSLLGAG